MRRCPIAQSPDESPDWQLAIGMVTPYGLLVLIRKPTDRWMGL
jgi:hypothetical protein